MTGPGRGPPLCGDELPGMGLALSGGGFRATLFHLGGLWRLNELGLLGQIDRIVGVSGGAILAAYLGMRWNRLAFQENVATNFDAEIVCSIRDFCSRNIDRWTFLLRVLPRPWAWRRAGNALAASYRSELFHDALLSDLPNRPVIIIAATNLLNGAPFSFRKSFAGDYLYGQIKDPVFRLSEAVAASSAFPPFFSPFHLSTKPHLFENPFDTELWPLPNAIYLSDGGIIDNSGLEHLWKRHGTVLITDAGAPAQFEKQVRPLWTSLTKRALDISTHQVEPLRKRLVMGGLEAGDRNGAYWSISAETNWFDTAGALPCDERLTSALARMRTRLNRFSGAEQSMLVNWGYAISDAAVRSRLLRESDVKEATWPYPAYPLNRHELIRCILR